MRIRVLTIILLLLTGLAAAEPVGRVESLHGDKKLFRQTGPAAQPYLSHIEQDAEIGHRFRTDIGSLASIRFFLGGNVGLGKDCEIEVINERDARVLTQGNYWMKFDEQDSDNPIRIQTAGGVMGIRGTEFVLRVEENGATELSLIEGKVDVEPLGGDRFEARPGMRVSFGGGTELRYQLYEVEKLLEQVRQELGPEFYNLRQTLQETREAIRDAKLQIRTASAEARTGLASARLGVLEGRRALRDAGLSSAGRRSGSANFDLADSILSSLERGEGLDDSADETATPVSDSEHIQCGPYPSLNWPGAPDQKFVVLLLDPEDEERVFWVAETVGPQYSYPEEAEPLATGDYTFRVVPMSPDGAYEQGTDFPIQVDES